MQNQVGIVIPTYLEGKNITNLIRAIREILPDSALVIVDDSPDTETFDAVNNMNFRNLKAIHRSEKGGRGSAVIEGISCLVSQGCQWIIEMDADFSHPPIQLEALLKEGASRKLDLLIASRYLPESRIVNWPLTRRIFSKLSNMLARTVLQVPVSDYTNGYRLYSRTAAVLVVETCGKLGKGFISLSEILVNIYYRGLAVGEVPTIFTNRIRGQSSLNVSEITNAFFGLFKIIKLRLRLNEKARCLTGNP